MVTTIASNDRDKTTAVLRLGVQHTAQAIPHRMQVRNHIRVPVAVDSYQVPANRGKNRITARWYAVVSAKTAILLGIAIQSKGSKRASAGVRASPQAKRPRKAPRHAAKGMDPRRSQAGWRVVPMGPITFSKEAVFKGHSSRLQPHASSPHAESSATVLLNPHAVRSAQARAVLRR